MMYVGNVAILENQYIDQQKGIEQDVAGCDCERMVEGGAMLTGQLLPRKPCDHQEENKQEPDVPATIKIDRPGTSHGQQRVDQIKCGSETSSEHDDCRAFTGLRVLLSVAHIIYQQDIYGKQSHGH